MKHNFPYLKIIKEKKMKYNKNSNVILKTIDLSKITKYKQIINKFFKNQFLKEINPFLKDINLDDLLICLNLIYIILFIYSFLFNANDYKTAIFLPNLIFD